MQPSTGYGSRSPARDSCPETVREQQARPVPSGTSWASGRNDRRLHVVVFQPAQAGETHPNPRLRTRCLKEGLDNFLAGREEMSRVALKHGARGATFVQARAS